MLFIAMLLTDPRQGDEFPSMCNSVEDYAPVSWSVQPSQIIVVRRMILGAGCPALLGEDVSYQPRVTGIPVSRSVLPTLE